jgi:uncharacterized membrane protein YsdA (DUF1294 family)
VISRIKRRPYLSWSLVGAIVAGVIGVVLEWATGLPPLWAYAVAINLATLLIYAADKGLAPRKGAPRVPNVVLILMALVGGSAGALLGVAAGHKTSRRYRWLRILLWVCLVGQLALLMWARIDASGPQGRR